ncbi:MAG: argininosuccinate synthase [Coriobacteriales bacterium]|nr:argininosuccinate synthase [Coriobacteriales bacterium]
MAKEKAVLAYSGGLDTSVIVRWLQNEKNMDVIAICGNVGQDEKDLDWVVQKAYKMGAIYAEALDMREEYCNTIVKSAIQANGMYEGVYPLLSALSRPVISKHLVDIAHQYGATTIVHGCTGKGNDQVRFETCIHALDPSLKIIAPVRIWDLTTRESEMDWAEQNDVPIPVTKKKPYSIDDNLWGRAIECGVLEDTWNQPPADIWTMTTDPEQAPDTPTFVEITFDAGVPVAIDGQKMDLLPLVVKANQIAGSNGYGRIDMIEDRTVGLKSRECYECPGAMLLIEAHKQLETLCLDRETLKLKQHMDQEWASQVYYGYWYSQVRNSIDAFNAYTQKFVSGTVRFKLYKGSLLMDGIKSDYSLYDYGLATYSEGDTFDRTASKGFIDIHSLENTTWSKVQGPASGNQPA